MIDDVELLWSNAGAAIKRRAACEHDTPPLGDHGVDTIHNSRLLHQLTASPISLGREPKERFKNCPDQAIPPQSHSYGPYTLS
jgi:hypothetical protein